MQPAPADVNRKAAPVSHLQGGEASWTPPRNLSCYDTIQTHHHASLDGLPAELLSTELVNGDQRVEESVSSHQIQHQSYSYHQQPDQQQQPVQQTGVQAAHEGTQQHACSLAQLHQLQHPLQQQAPHQQHPQLGFSSSGTSTNEQPAHVHLVLPQSRYPDVTAAQLQPGEAAQLVLLRPATKQQKVSLPPPKPSNNGSSTPLWSYKSRHDHPAKRIKKSNKREGAPKRPRSAYLHFLSDFRGKFHQANPQVRKVSEMAQYAGQAWRGLPEDQKSHYQQLSAAEKTRYAVAIEAFDAVNPRSPRREDLPTQQRLPTPVAAKAPQETNAPAKTAAAHGKEPIDIEGF